ncbi:MAG: sporulation protein YqfD [Clostridia bacterium]|nr:sporulation protein YqfD [Clostridia bacterium]
MTFVLIVLSYIFGYIRISVEGYYIERFINICKTNKILIWNLKREKGTNLYLNVRVNEFKKITEVSKKTKCRIKIVKKRGVPFILNKYRKRKIFAIFLLLMICAVIVSSKYVWNIEIKVEDGKEVPGIIEEIEKAGLVIGKKKSDINAKEIINQIRLDRQDISWIGIEMKGTNVIVKIVTSEEAPQIIDENDYCNIVAKKSGIITKITAQNGTAKVNVGDTVKEGTVLIEGTMTGKYTDVRYVHSIGDVEAKVWYTKSEKIYYKKEEKVETGQEENKYKLKINNFQINFYKTLSKFKIYDTIEQENKIKLFSDLYLPISVVKVTNKEQQVNNQEYTPEEAKNIGIEKIKEELKKQVQTDVVQEIITTNETDEYIEVNVTFEVIENIGTEEKILF